MIPKSAIPMILTAMVLTGLPLSGKDAAAIEKASYTVIEKNGKLELRQYAPHIVAETLVEGSFDEVGNEGFRRLVAYIKGENRTRQSIAMTAPVSQRDASEKIAMTAPVSQEKAGGKWRITFLMPSKYTLETLPEPLDERITLKAEPGALMAAIRYSGTWSGERYQTHLAKLQAWVKEQNWQPTGEPVWARYDPPFMPWFLRRNEVLLPVAR